MSDTEIRKLQVQAAACTDELLDITEDIGAQVLPLYKEADRMMFDLQCRLQLKRCRNLTAKLEEIRELLAEASAAEQTEAVQAPAPQDPAPAADPFRQPLPYGGHGDGQTEAAAERISSARITRQLIDQNLLLTGQKAALLQELLGSSAQAAYDRLAAEKMKDAAQIAQLKNALAKETELCRSEKETSY